MSRARIFLVALTLTSLAPLAPAARAQGEEPAAPQTQAIPQAHLPKSFVVPAAEKNKKNPVPPSAESISNGRTLFTTQCTMCHGPKGDGKGDLAVRLKMSVPSFTDPRTQARRTDGELFYILTNGHGRMPADGDRILAQHKWDIINFIRSLAPAPKPAQ